MRKKLPLLPTIVLPIWVLSLLFSLSLYAQPSKEYGSKTVAALKQSGMAASSVSGSLRNMIILPSPHSIKVELFVDGLLPQYQTFKLSQPSRLVIDFPQMFSSYAKKFIDLNHSLLKEIRFGQHPDKLRMVLTFPGKEVPPYEIRKEPNGLTIWIGKVEKESAEIPRSTPEGKKGPPVKTPGEEKSTPEKPSVEVAVPQEIKPEERKAISKEPKTKEEPRAIYSGTKISLDYVNADIRNIFQFLADTGKVEIILAPEIRGTITLRLVDIPWDEALDAILAFHNLKKIREGNKIRILPQ